jgi:hypothetical protein
MRHEARRRLPASGKGELQQLLVELAAALLPHGVTPSGFSRLAREAFVEAAADRSRLRNGRINHSKVAAITGLPRRQISRILNRQAVGVALDRKARTPTERVVQGWLTDRRFISRQGQPKSLGTGRASAFWLLVKEYGGDISPRAVLEELTRSRVVRNVGGRLELRTSKLPGPTDNLGSLALVIPTLLDGLRIASRESELPLNSLINRLTLYASSEAELTLIRQRCLSSIQGFVHGLRESLERQVTVPVRKRVPRHELSITVLLADVSGSVGGDDRRQVEWIQTGTLVK